MTWSVGERPDRAVSGCSGPATRPSPASSATPANRKSQMTVVRSPPKGAPDRARANSRRDSEPVYGDDRARLIPEIYLLGDGQRPRTVWVAAARPHARGGIQRSADDAAHSLANVVEFVLEAAHPCSSWTTGTDGDGEPVLRRCSRCSAAQPFASAQRVLDHDRRSRTPVLDGADGRSAGRSAAYSSPSNNCLWSRHVRPHRSPPATGHASAQGHVRRGTSLQRLAGRALDHGASRARCDALHRAPTGRRVLPQRPCKFARGERVTPLNRTSLATQRCTECRWLASRASRPGAAPALWWCRRLQEPLRAPTPSSTPRRRPWHGHHALRAHLCASPTATGTHHRATHPPTVVVTSGSASLPGREPERDDHLALTTTTGQVATEQREPRPRRRGSGRRGSSVSRLGRLNVDGLYRGELRQRSNAGDRSLHRLRLPPSFPCTTDQPPDWPAPVHSAARSPDRRHGTRRLGNVDHARGCGSTLPIGSRADSTT